MKEVVVKRGRGKYRNKNNPAVELIDKVIENKEKNRISAYDYVQYQHYEKIGLSLANKPEKILKNKLFRSFKFIMENVDTRYMKFGPDVGQIQKGGGDPVKICKDFMELIEHVHLKDFAGGDNGYLGYSPLGEGKVQIATIMDMIEKRKKKMAGMVMFELDYDNRVKPPYTPLEAAKISRDFMAKLDYKFEPKTI
jgi:sugar phosphate isomerase/epimerase